MLQAEYQLKSAEAHYTDLQAGKSWPDQKAGGPGHLTTVAKLQADRGQ
jgi:hypothetical protein